MADETLKEKLRQISSVALRGIVEQFLQEKGSRWSATYLKKPEVAIIDQEFLDWVKKRYPWFVKTGNISKKEQYKAGRAAGGAAYTPPPGMARRAGEWIGEKARGLTEDIGERSEIVRGAKWAGGKVPWKGIGGAIWWPFGKAFGFLGKAWGAAGETEREKWEKLTKEIAQIIWLSLFTALAWFLFKLFPNEEFSAVIFWIIGLLYIIKIVRAFGFAAPKLMHIVNFTLIAMLIPVGLRYFSRGVRLVHNLIPQFPIFIITIALLTIPIIAVFTIMPLGEEKLGKWLRIILLIWYIFFIILLFTAPAFWAEDQDYGLIEQQKEMFMDWLGAFYETFAFIPRGIQREIAFASGDYFVGQVDEGSRKKLGVFIEDISAIATTFRQDEPVDVFATIKAESMGEEALNVSLKCYSDSKQGQIVPEQYKQFTVYQYEQQEVDCIFEPGKLGRGIQLVSFESEFEFDTSAYLKTYLMKRDVVREYRRQDLDPLEVYKIQDKQPTAVFTEGPLGIGIGAKASLPITVQEKGEPGPTIGITFENRWGGELKEMKEIQIIMPFGLEITSVSGEALPLDACTVNVTTLETTCTLTENIISDLVEEQTKDIRLLRLYTVFDEPDVLFRYEQEGKSLEAPLAIKNIKVRAKYIYKIKRSTEVTVK